MLIIYKDELIASKWLLYLQTSYRLVHVVSLVSKAPIRLAVKSPEDGDNISLRTVFGGDLSIPETPSRLTYNFTKAGTGLAPVE